MEQELKVVSAEDVGAGISVDAHEIAVTLSDGRTVVVTPLRLSQGHRNASSIQPLVGSGKVRHREGLLQPAEIDEIVGALLKSTHTVVVEMMSREPWFQATTTVRKKVEELFTRT